MSATLYYVVKDGYLVEKGATTDKNIARRLEKGEDIRVGYPAADIPIKPAEIVDDYQRRRRKEYPSIEEQLDAIWKGGADMEAMRQRINGVKKKHPK